VPLGPRETLADLAVALGSDVILVVGMRLGCINHALLTAEAIRADGLQLAGWVANQVGERMACHEENVDTLRQLLPAPLLGELPHLKPFDPKKAAQNLDIKTLF
jgi:dethiobiotin synthetase